MLAHKQDGRERQRTIILISEVSTAASERHARGMQSFYEPTYVTCLGHERVCRRVSAYILTYITYITRPIADDVAMWCNILFRWRDFAVERTLNSNAGGDYARGIPFRGMV